MWCSTLSLSRTGAHEVASGSAPGTRKRETHRHVAAIGRDRRDHQAIVEARRVRAVNLRTLPGRVPVAAGSGSWAAGRRRRFPLPCRGRPPSANPPAPRGRRRQARTAPGASVARCSEPVRARLRRPAAGPAPNGNVAKRLGGREWHGCAEKRLLCVTALAIAANHRRHRTRHPVIDARQDVCCLLCRNPRRHPLLPARKPPPKYPLSRTPSFDLHSICFQNRR